MWTTHLAPCIWKIVLTVNNYLLVYKPLLEVYYWIQKQKRKKNMKNTFYWQFFNFTILMLYFFSFGCWPCEYLMQIPILYGRFCLYLTDCHMLLQTSTSDKIKKSLSFLKHYLIRPGRPFMATLRCFLPVRQYSLYLICSTICLWTVIQPQKERDQKVISNLSSFMSRVLGESEFKCIWDHSPAEWTVVLVPIISLV